MPDSLSLIMMLGLLIAIGAFAGLVAGLLGVGGGIVLVPAFFYAFTFLGYGGDHLMQVCVATSLATIVFTSARSVQAHHKKGAVDWGMLWSWSPFIVAGAIFGTVTASQVTSLTLQAVFGALAGLAGIYMAFGRTEWRLGAALPGQPLRGIYAGALGVFSAMMGIGGGTFGVPLMSLYSYPIHRAVATASGIGMVIATPAVIGFAVMTVTDAPPLTLGAINIPAFLAVQGSTMLTTPMGARWAHRMDAAPLRRAFALFLTVVALNMLRKVWAGI